MAAMSYHGDGSWGRVIVGCRRRTRRNRNAFGRAVAETACRPGNSGCHCPSRLQLLCMRHIDRRRNTFTSTEGERQLLSTGNIVRANEPAESKNGVGNHRRDGCRMHASCFGPATMPCLPSHSPTAVLTGTTHAQPFGGRSLLNGLRQRNNSTGCHPEFACMPGQLCDVFFDDVVNSTGMDLTHGGGI